MLGPERPEAVLPDRALYLPTFSQLLMTINFSLPPSPSPLLPLRLKLRLILGAPDFPSIGPTKLHKIILKDTKR